MEDAQIIELFFARSEDAISELDKKYGKLCHKLADNILASAQDAEECVNDAYLSTWHAIPPQRPESLPAFVGTLVRRCSITRYRANTAMKRNSHSEAFRQDRKRKSHKLFSIQKFAAFTSSRINRFILSSKVSLLSLLK